ncbi:MAG: hypothetical protein U1E87_06410 [Alphaproteobacteria bacterium]
MHQILLSIHVWTGTIGLIAGTAALVFRKGSGPHRAAGAVFVSAMLLMAASATVLAIMKSNTGLAVGGLMAFYMIATAFMSVHRREGETGAFEVGAFAMAVGVALSIASSAVLMATGRISAPNAYVATATYGISGIMALAAAGDLSVILRRGLTGRQRIARHLWRMCFGLFIAAGSFGAQGAKILQIPPQSAGMLIIGSMIIIFTVMIYWLVRVLFTDWYERA